MKYHRRNLTIFLLFVFAGSFITSCIKDEFDYDKLSKNLEIEPSVAVPVGYTTMSLEKMLRDTTRPDLLTIDEDGLLWLKYHKQAFSYRAEDVVQFPDKQHDGAIKNQADTIFDLIDVAFPRTFTKTISFDFAFSEEGGERLDSIWLKSGNLVIEAGSSAFSGEMSVTIPGLQNNGEAFSQQIPLNGTTGEIDLSGYSLKLTNNPPLTNRLEIEIEVTIESGSGNVSPGGDIVDFSFDFSSIAYEAIFGYLGELEINTDLTSYSIEIYDRIVDGVFHFEDPRLNIYFNNSFGIPIEVGLSDFKALTREDGMNTFTGDMPTMNNRIIINYPTIEQVGESVKDSFQLNSSNTNLISVFDNAPTKIFYWIYGKCNPNGNTDNNFITDNSRYNVDVEFELPIWGYADFLVLQDTMVFETKDFFKEDFDEIKRLVFRLNTTNSFPVEIHTQLYFADENYVILDSMFQDTKLIASGEDLDGDGKFDPVESEPVEAELTRERIDNIESCKYLIMKGRIKTWQSEATPPESVKFYVDYALDAYLGVIADLELNTSDL